MKKSLFLVSCTLLLVSLSCQVMIPQDTPQPQVTLAVATLPAAQPEPTQEQPAAPTAPPSTATLPPAPTEEARTATQPPTPTTAVVLEDMTLMFWEARVSYNPVIWQPTGGEYPRSLAHQQISTCILYEQGPTEPPPADREVRLGAVTYRIAELNVDGNPAHWYMAVQGPQGPFADGIPTLVVSSSPDSFEQCRSSAEEVLATMR